MVGDTGTAADLLARLRARQLTVELRTPADPAAPLRLVVTPGSALTDEDKAALKEHREALLDLLWAEPHPSDQREIGWT
jgi:hypothetical protein